MPRKPTALNGPVKPRGRQGGRPSLSGTPYSRKVQTRITGAEGDSLAAWARQEGLTDSEYLRRIIQEHLRSKQFPG